MSRLTISLPDNLHKQLSALAIKNNASMSNVVNQLIQVGLHQWFSDASTLKENTPIEKHCHQLIIQMNALVKNISVELLKLDKDDFERLQQAAHHKYVEIQQSGFDKR